MICTVRCKNRTEQIQKAMKTDILTEDGKEIKKKEISEITLLKDNLSPTIELLLLFDTLSIDIEIIDAFFTLLLVDSIK